ncbi:hypothetical protein [Breoghania sp.]|uniref:hypothetical protein n=1 Tax=Breoghania sp. TaxID=2065378 RepID=UPI002AAACC2E|nr:hypothetical protein [Breoghania sp.]
MQIIESSIFGVRSVRMVLTSKDHPHEVTLFPMIHIGEATFFEAVIADAVSHDIVLHEGVKSRHSKRLTRSYRWAAVSKKLGLRLQQQFRAKEICDTRVIRADLDTDEFDRLWRGLPFRLRCLAYFLPSLVGLQRRLFATRESLAEGIAMSDHTSSQEWLDWGDDVDAFFGVILRAHDRRLIECLEEVLAEPCDEPRRIAIVYGARHMRAVLRHLTKDYRFRVSENRWMTVWHL